MLKNSIIVILALLLIIISALAGAYYGQTSQYRTPDVMFKTARNAAVSECEKSQDADAMCLSMVLVDVSEANLGNDVSGTFYTYQKRLQPKNDLKYEVLVNKGRIVSVGAASTEKIK